MVSLVQRLAQNPGGMIGTALLGLLLLAGFGVSWIPYFDPIAQNLAVTVRPPSLKASDGRINLLGTDQLGRDILSRLLVGLRISLLVALSVVPISMLLGLTVGLLGGYFGGQLDVILMRIVDAQYAIPTLLLLIAAIAVVGTGLVQIVSVLAIAGWPTYARLIRAEVIALREREFVVSAVAVGTHDSRILLRHILPNILPTTIVLATLQLPTVIILEASLSFLGLGIQPPTPSLGQMLGHSQEVFWRAWWMPAIPGVAISLLALSFNLVGDRLRDILDPRLRGFA